MSATNWLRDIIHWRHVLQRSVWEHHARTNIWWPCLASFMQGWANMLRVRGDIANIAINYDGKGVVEEQLHLVCTAVERCTNICRSLPLFSVHLFFSLFVPLLYVTSILDLAPGRSSVGLRAWVLVVKGVTHMPYARRVCVRYLIDFTLPSRVLLRKTLPCN